MAEAEVQMGRRQKQSTDKKSILINGRSQNQLKKAAAVDVKESSYLKKAAVAIVDGGIEGEGIVDRRSRSWMEEKQIGGCVFWLLRVVYSIAYYLTGQLNLDLKID